MKTILLLQFRKNDLIARHEKKCILNCLGVANLVSKNVFKNDFKILEKEINKISAIIIGGSGDFSFSRKETTPDLWEKINKLTPLIKNFAGKNIPILGICFGHQYLAYIFGSEIIRDESQKEVGTFELHLTKSGRRDGLFYKIPSNFSAQEGHEDSVKKLPKGAILLAQGTRCKIQTFRFKNIYGVQFHPELSSIKDLELRSRFYPHYAPSAAKINYRPSPFAKKVIKNFVKII